MEYIAQAKDYWIAPQAVKITLNALGNPHRTQATVASGAVIMCYIKGVDGLEYDNGHQYRAWNISASPTYFNTATKKYVYAAIPRSSEVGVQAVIVYPSELLDIYGCNEDGDQVGSEHFYYIWLQGVISESAYNRANRYWLTDIDYGILATDEARDDQSYNTDWYTFNAVTQTVTFLKEIIMKAGSSFRNLILGGHNLTGVATGDTPEDIDSDTLVVTPNYIRNKFLHKDRDDTTPYSLTIEQELRVGNRGIMNHLQSTDYTGDGMLDSGYKLWYEEGRAKLVIDDLVARGKFTVNELETRIWTYAGGNMVFSGAGSTIFYVEYLDANDEPLGYTYINQPWLLRGRALLAASLSWSKRRQIQRQLTDTERAAVVKFRCYEYSDDGTMQTRNWWKPNDIAMCQTMNKVREKQNSDGSYSGSASNTVYKRRIAGIGSKEIPMLNDGRVYDYVDLWNVYDLAGSGCSYMGTDGQEHLITDQVKGFLNMAPSGATPSTDWPAAGDVIVQMGNPLDTDRQAAVTIEVQGDVHGFKVYDTISDYSLANDLWVEIGYDQTTGKAKANVFGDFRFGCRESEEAQGGSYVKYNRTTKQLDIKANVRFMSPTSPQQETTLDSFASAVVGDLSNLQSQIDGQIESWFYNYSPVHVDSEGVPDSNVPLNVAPYSDWTTDALKIAHLGDTFTNNETGYCWRFSRNATTNAFEWVIIEDSAVIKALQDAARAQDTADHKRRVFICDSSNQTPTPPYDAGDLWVNVKYPWATGATYDNEMLKCVTSKASGASFSISDWSLANGYTAKLNNFVTNTYAPFAQSIQTQVDKKAETYRQATNPASSWVEADKPSHVGDIWMDISTNGGKKTYIYQNTAAAGQTPVYDWVAQEVPDEVFDEIDGKTAIYVGWNDWVVDNVSQLNDKDLFIPAADVTPTGSSVTYYANKVYRWDATNSTWNEVAYTDDTYAHGFDYLKAAMKGDTQIQGGLLLSNTIVLRNLNGTTPTDVMAGMNGILNPDLPDPKTSIAAWYGGDMVDLEDLTHYWTTTQINTWNAMSDADKAASVLVAKSLDRFDGSGYRASGNISWDKAGNVTLKGQVVTATTKIDTPAIFLNGTDITATLNALLEMFEKVNVAGQGETPLYMIHAKYGLYADGDLQALGYSPSQGGGGGGASVLYELYDVTPNAANNEVSGIVITDGQTTAGDGFVLTFDGATRHWIAAAPDPAYILPQATSGVLGGIKIGYTDTTAGTRNYPVELNGSGQAFVNVPWTDNDHYDWDDITNKPRTFAPSSGSSYYLTRDAWWTNGETHDANDLRSGVVFAYSTQSNVPVTGTMVAFSCRTNNNYALQLQGAYNLDTLYFRNRNGDGNTWKDWHYVIHDGNIGSQSVSYATSAGSAGSATTASKLGSSNVGGSDNPIYLSAGTATACNYPASGNWFRGVVRVGSDGVMETGRYIDFHPTNASTLDYNVRIDAGNGTTQRIFTFPDTAGTLLSSGNSSVTKSGSTLTVKINGTEQSLTDTNTWRPLGTGASDACAGNDSRLSDARPASDVYSWAKASTKPSYNLDEVSDGTTRKLSNYIAKSGGTMTGTLDLRSNAYGGPSGDHGLDCNNSDIVNVNSIYTSDTAGSWDEGFEFKRTNGNWDSLYALDGSFYMYANNGSAYANLYVAYGYASSDFQVTSDEREKDVIGNVELTVEQIAKMPSVLFRWKDKRDDLIHVGTLAQKWEPVLPQAVGIANDEQKTRRFSYSSAAYAMAHADACEIVALKKRVALLESIIRKHNIA